MIKIFIIDDSMMLRNSLKKALKTYSNIAIIGEAPNPVDAMAELKRVGLPDVFILDIEMPKMDGLSFLKKLKEQRPIPTIIFSSVVGNGSTKAIEAMELGACDIVKKPDNINKIDKDDFFEEFVLKIKAASKSKHIEQSVINIEKVQVSTDLSTNKVIAIGASTGGVQTIETIVTNLEKNHPPIVITQHMPVGFTKSFSLRLNKLCLNSTAKEVEDGELLKVGGIYIAPGNLHLEIEKVNSKQYKAVLKDYPKVSNHKPSVDVLFKSVAKEAKENSLAFILTGMGKDGANGIKKIKDSGGKTYGQDEQSCVVYGMPKVAFEMQALDKQVSLEEIVNIINNCRR